jgi:2-keto-4-pentenoate hydratase/2-oxohepta-3-ene-1,7-dioic acid hydratase in catechol pathway
MKLITYIESGRHGVGVIEGEAVIDLTRGGFASSMLELIGKRDLLGRAIQEAKQSGAARPLKDLRIAAPIPVPHRNIFCVGKNYREHAVEFGKSGFDAGAIGGEEVPEYPIIFSKPPSCVIAPDEHIRADLDPYASVDYEGELAVIIGRDGLVSAGDDPQAFIFGYTVFNDVTSRELQKRHKQWLLGKGIDTFGPLGPAIVTPDEMPPFNSAYLRTWVNGELRQEAKLSNLIFDVDHLIRTIGRSTTLKAGDIIATGTPVGVGIGFRPPRYLAKGDKVTVQIDGIGALTNEVA